MNKTDFHDQYGFLHHAKTHSAGAMTSENGPLFTGEELVLKFMVNEATVQDARNFFASISHLYDGKGWRVTPISSRYDFSKDNWFGVWAAVLCVRKYYPGVYKQHEDMVNNMPLFHKQLLHPISFMIVAKAKYGWSLFDKIIKWDFMRAARETHKKRGGRLIAKTDMKIMAWCLMFAFGWDAGEYNAMVKGMNTPVSNIPESFKVLTKELEALGLNVVLS